MRPRATSRGPPTKSVPCLRDAPSRPSLRLNRLSGILGLGTHTRAPPDSPRDPVVRALGHGNLRTHRCNKPPQIGCVSTIVDCHLSRAYHPEATCQMLVSICSGSGCVTKTFIGEYGIVYSDATKYNDYINKVYYSRRSSRYPRAHRCDHATDLDV